MKNEIYEKLCNGEVAASFTSKNSPIPEEVIILVEQNSSDQRLIQFIPMLQAVKDFNDADENEYISFTVLRYLLWYTRVNNVNVVASAVAKLM